MRSLRILSSIAVLPTAFFAHAELDFDAGADLRIRQEMMENVPGLPGGGQLSSAVRGQYKNHMRFRPRVWGEVSGLASDESKWRLYARLTDESRWYVQPSRPRPFAFPDEVILDNLYLEAKDLFDGRLDFRAGRQDIYALYGLDHVFVDGTPSDGSRTVYSDMVRVGWNFEGGGRLDLFGLYDFDDCDIRWGTDAGHHRSLSGFGASDAEPCMDDWGYGAIWTDKIAEDVPYNAFLMQKNTRSYLTGNVKRHPGTQRNLVGLKTVPKLNANWSLQFEAMGQVGNNDDGQTLLGASSYAGVNWRGNPVASFTPFGKVGYHFMSGDDDAADEDGGHTAWDPMWARGVNDSEMFLYGTHYGAGWWSNMHYAKATLGVDMGPHHRLTGSCGPLFAAAQDGLGGGDGMFKGFLSQIRYDFPLMTSSMREALSWGGKGHGLDVFGHLVAEFFNPGDYYETEKPAWFVRWQIDIKF